MYDIFAGGVGGQNGKDGSATSFHLSNGKIAPVEIIKSEFPTQVERFELLRDSGGPGRHRRQKTGDVLRVERPGGGVGAAFERSAEAVLDDVRQGYVSVERARRDYGVVARDDGSQVTSDPNATRDLRLAVGEPKS